MDVKFEINLNYQSKFQELNLQLMEKKTEHLQVLQEESQNWNITNEVEKYEILKYKENSNALHLKIQKIHEDISSAQTMMKSMDQEIKITKNEIQEKENDLKIHLKKKKLLQGKLLIIESRIKEEEKSLLCSQDMAQVKIEQATNCVHLFKRYLGLRFTKTSKGSLLIIFTQVIRSNPDKEFLVELCIEKDKYSILQTNPPIENLESIETRLNSTSNFCGFLVYIRSVFEKMDS